jgi:hypothetical protein
MFENLDEWTFEALLMVKGRQIAEMNKEIGSILIQRGLDLDLPAIQLFRYLPNEEKRNKFLEVVNKINSNR